MTAAEKAAYKALAAYRMNAEQRERAAKKVVALLADVPVNLLPGVVDLGHRSGFAHELVLAMYPVAMNRRTEAAAVAIAAAAEVLCAGGAS